MKRNNMILTLLVVMVITGVAQPVKQPLTKSLEDVCKQAIDQGLFSGEAVVVKNGDVVFRKRAGFADPVTKRPIMDETLYNIGSLTKQFTEEMIWQLMRDGKLSGADAVSKYLNIFPPEVGYAITIDQLLTMRSGLGDYFGSPEFRRIEQSNFALKDILDIIARQPLLFEPGTGQAYSNSGYVVLGAIIENITGKSYEENLRTRIVTPLGMTHVYYTKGEKMAQKVRAFGQVINLDGSKTVVDDVSHAHPDGGIYSTLGDILKFVEAKRNRQLPSHHDYPPEGRFGGGTSPWNAAIGYQGEYSYVILCNVGESADRIALRVGSILQGDPWPALTPPVQVTLYQWITQHGMEYVEKHIRELCEQERKHFDSRFLNSCGDLFMLGNQPDMALSLFNLNVKLFPESPAAYDFLAGAYLRMGDKKNARMNYEKVLEIDPLNRRVRELLDSMRD